MFMYFYINVCIDYVNLKNIQGAVDKLNGMFNDAEDQQDYEDTIKVFGTVIKETAQGARDTKAEMKAKARQDPAADARGVLADVAATRDADTTYLEDTEAVCKSIFMDGVTRRFPDLNFGFLEGGVGFACLLYADLIGHWEIRNEGALDDTNPANLDLSMLAELAEQYGGPEVAEAVKAGKGLSTRSGPETTGGLTQLDDYARCDIGDASDFKGLFADRFYFGCEADDPTNAWAFNKDNNPFGAELKTLFGSDIGHFDVREMAGVLPEAHELVEDGKIDQDGFRRFVFENPAHFFAETNPDFFTGSVVADAVASLDLSKPY